MMNHILKTNFEGILFLENCYLQGFCEKLICEAESIAKVF
jgi:hypothetical protein